MKQTMTQKREYERPRMNVVELKHRMRLLAGSDYANPRLQNYSTHEYVEE